MYIRFNRNFPLSSWMLSQIHSLLWSCAIKAAESEILAWTFLFELPSLFEHSNRITWPSGLAWVQNISTPYRPNSPNLRKPGPTDQSATVGWQWEPSLLLSFFSRNKLSKLSSLFFFSSIIQPGPCIFMKKKRGSSQNIYLCVVNEKKEKSDLHSRTITKVRFSTFNYENE